MGEIIQLSAAQGGWKRSALKSVRENDAISVNGINLVRNNRDQILLRCCHVLAGRNLRQSKPSAILRVPRHGFYQLLQEADRLRRMAGAHKQGRGAVLRLK